jgi:hypothetical protein
MPEHWISQNEIMDHAQDPRENSRIPQYTPHVYSPEPVRIERRDIRENPQKQEVIVVDNTQK